MQGFFELEHEKKESVIVSLEHKMRDDFTKENKYYPLISDIRDKEGVMIEHRKLNGNDWRLHYALLKTNNKYYFFDIRKNVMEIKKYTDEKEFICPYCGGILSPVPDYYRKDRKDKIEAYLRHKHSENEKVKNCIFNLSNKDYKKKQKGYFEGESLKHKFFKIEMYKKAKEGTLFLNLYESYELVEKDYDVEIKWNERKVKIVDAYMERKVLKKDEITNGYQPDLVLISDKGEHIYCEITVTSGKTVEEYYDIWRRLNKNVIEIRESDNKGMYEKNNICFEELKIRNLYSIVIDRARREKHKRNIELAEKKRKEMERKIQLEKKIEAEKREKIRREEERKKKEIEIRKRKEKEERERKEKEETERLRVIEQKRKEYQEEYERLQKEKQEKERQRKEKEQQEAERKEKAKIKYLTKIDDIPLSRIAEVWDMYNIQKWETVKEWVLTKEIKNSINYAFRMYEKEHYPQTTLWDI